MALIKCSECGRAVSDKAATCVGCGAPLPRPSAWRGTGFNVAPEPSRAPPPTRRQLIYRALAALVVLILGLIGSSAFDHLAGANHLYATMAALLVIIGLCGLIVTAVQLMLSRK